MATVKAKYSNFMQKISNHEFILTGELEPGRSVNIQPIIEEAQEIKPYVVAANVTDNPGSFVAMNGLTVASYLQEKTELELIVQLTCRDTNRMGLASSLLAAGAVGIKNILVLTGDHTSLGDIPDSKPVFDLDSAQLLLLAREIVDKHTVYGNLIENWEEVPPQFHIGIGVNPNTDHIEAELLKIERKVELGAEFIQTQVVFDMERAEPFFHELKKFNLPVLVGVFPMKNYTTARDFNSFVPGVHIPPWILKKFQDINESNREKKAKHEAYDQLNIEILKPIMVELQKKGFAAGCHITAVHYTRIFPKLLKK
jgi:5,10-methylenetetrahydrofolate reductase